MATETVERLKAAHVRIEEKLALLEHAADHLAEPDSLATMRSVLEFFSTFAKDHQDEEEKLLFPRLRARPDCAQMLGAFEFQHRMNATEEKAFAACVHGFVPGGEGELRARAHRFADMQRAHMHAEEHALFPLIEKL